MHKETPLARDQAAPPGSAFAHLKPRDLLGGLFTTLCVGLTLLALLLSSQAEPLLWLLGQLVLAVALLQWFVLLHETGHNTLFRTQLLNRLVGHAAGYFALIPYSCWKRVHGAHHHWTGWQDLDLTTAPLVPRQLSWIERVLVNVCWRCWIPLFSVIYRLNNFWNLPRLYRLFPDRSQQRQFTCSVLVYLILYGLTVYLVGWLPLLQAAGVGLLLCLVMQDILILSQHTHVAQELSHGEPVRPFQPVEQEVYTRSLRFPRWFSTLVLLNLDAHELHHMYTRIPGYYLRRVNYTTRNEVSWWRWLVKAKRMPGAVFLFQNRLQSGYDV